MKKTWDRKELRRILKLTMDLEQGYGVSDADRAYKRGWRDCIRALRTHFGSDSSAARNEDQK